MKKTILYLVILFAIPNWMCKKENACDCLKGTGDISNEERALASFSSVEVEDNVNVIFQEDTLQQVTVQAGANLIQNITTDIVEGKLVIKNKNKCNFVRRYDIPINVYIHVLRNQIFSIKTMGTGLISNTNSCTNDSIDLQIESSGDIEFQMGGLCKTYTHQHGAGDLTLKGSCEQLIIYSKGTGFTITDACTNIYTWVYTNTTGKITVQSTALLIAIIDGSGNVYYTGNPNTIQKTENATGKLLPL